MVMMSSSDSGDYSKGADDAAVMVVVVVMVTNIVCQ